MNNNVGRVLTLCVEITDAEKSEWIWKGHVAGGLPELGIRVHSISDGDLLNENEKLKMSVGFYLREEGEETDEAVEAHEEPFHSVDEATLAADMNVDPGAKYDVIDWYGNVHASGVSTPKKESCVR